VAFYKFILPDSEKWQFCKFILPVKVKSDNSIYIYIYIYIYILPDSLRSGLGT